MYTDLREIYQLKKYWQIRIFRNENNSDESYFHMLQFCNKSWTIKRRHTGILFLDVIKTSYFK